MSRLNFLLDTCQSAFRRMSAASEEQGVLEALNAAARDLGFSGVAYAFHLPQPALAVDHDFSSVWPAEINREWIFQGLHLRNPINAAVQRLEKSATWNTADISQADPEYRAAFSFVARTDAKAGCMVRADCALAGPGILVGSLDQAGRIDPQMVDALEVIGSAAVLNVTTLRTQTEARVWERRDDISLSDRQLEIVRWIVNGKTNAEIAMIMGLSERNVIYHVGQIFRKLGIASRAQAAAWFFTSPYAYQL